MPEVSVIIPTYNSARYIPAAIESILAQTLQDIEVLVIDDGSEDDTNLVVRRYGGPVHYFYQKNHGVAAARNRGIEKSRGRYIAFLDADDTWLPHKLERQLVGLKEHPEVGACYAAHVVVDANLTPLAIQRSQQRVSTLADLLTRGNVVGSLCTVVCQRSLFKEVGGFDPALSQCADWDMWVRLATMTEFLYIDEPLATYRQHGANMSRNVPLLEYDSLRVLEKGFAMPGLSDSLRAQHRAALARNYMVLAGSYFRAHCYRDFARCAARAVALDVRQASYLAAYPVRAATRSRQQPITEAM
jgi:glycosyltransferase involved in cell wall biosynthesis